MRTMKCGGRELVGNQISEPNCLMYMAYLKLFYEKITIDLRGINADEYECESLFGRVVGIECNN